MKRTKYGNSWTRRFGNRRTIPGRPADRIGRHVKATVVRIPRSAQQVDNLIREKGNGGCGCLLVLREPSGQPADDCRLFQYGIHAERSLPIYVGGLGNVAGDQLKSASDLGVPVVGIGLLYQQGYFRQMIDRNGEQRDYYPYNDPGQLPITPLRAANGDWLRLEVPFPGEINMAADLAGTRWVG